MNANATIIARELREVANQFLGLPSLKLSTDEEFSASQKLCDRAGKLMMQAADLGLLPQATESAAWTRGEALHPAKGKAVLARCPSNVLAEFIGNDRITVQRSDGGLLVVAGRHGGVLPERLPLVFAADESADKLALKASACMAIADLIEERSIISKPTKNYDRGRVSQSSNSKGRPRVAGDGALEAIVRDFEAANTTTKEFERTRRLKSGTVKRARDTLNQRRRRSGVKDK